MFWAETLKHACRFCVCEAVWCNFKIINALVAHDILVVHMTPENGDTCLIFRMRNGESLPKNLINFSFNFKAAQHVKIDIYGGDIVIVGETQDGAGSRKASNRFPVNCPFGEEGWGGNNPKKIRVTLDEAIEVFRKNLITKEIEIGGIIESPTMFYRHFKLEFEDDKALTVRCSYDSNYLARTLKISCCEFHEFKPERILSNGEIEYVDLTTMKQTYQMDISK